MLLITEDCSAIVSNNTVLQDVGLHKISIITRPISFLMQLQKFTLIQRPTMSVKLVVLYKSELWQTGLAWMVPHYSTQRMTQLWV